MVLEYFVKYYIQFALPSMPITEMIFLICVVVTFNTIDRSKRTLTLILHVLCLWGFLIIIKGVLKNTDINYTYIYALVAAPYAIFCGRHQITQSILRFLTLWTAYVFGTTFAKATANVVCSLLSIVCKESILYVFLAVILSAQLILFTVLMKRLSLRTVEQIAPWNLIVPVIVCITANIAKIFIDGIKEEGLPFFGATEAESSVFIFFIGILIYLLNILSYYMCYSNAKTLLRNNKIDKTLLEIQQKNAEQKDEADIIRQNLEEMRSIRHEIKNQLAYMQIMISQKDYGRLEEYFSEFNREISEPMGFCDCDNATIRNALRLEQYKAHQSGVNIDAKVVVPTEIGILDSDLSALIINLLDNAIEAVEEDSVYNAEIETNICVRNDLFFIKVVNPIRDPEKLERRKKLTTGKENKVFHGRGTKIIASIAKKYNGTFEYTADEQSFTVEVMLVQNKKE